MSGEARAAPRDRKAEHIELALDRQMQVAASAFDAWRFEHNALPEIGWDEIDLAGSFLGKRLRAPLLVSCMTGGTGQAARINSHLAAAAESAGVAIGVGSQRKALEDRTTAATFAVRALAPTVPLLANLGAVQLNYGYGVDQCRRAVDMIEADALVLHLNPLQEAIQPEGDRNFRHLLPRIAEVVVRLPVPVIVKEIGCGLSEKVAEQLRRVGVEWLDTAGLGGTSWARIEAARAGDRELGELFADWGIETPDSILALRRVPGVRVIASGGVRSGLDAAKALALGAELVGMAHPFLAPALESAAAVAARIERTVNELRICMLCVGARSRAELARVPPVRGAHPGAPVTGCAQVPAQPNSSG